MSTTENNEQNNNKEPSKLLVEIGAKIESHRCLATELEACISLTTILLQNPNGLSVPELEYHQRQKKHHNEEEEHELSQDKDSNNNTIPKGVLDAIETLQTVSTTVPSQENETITIGKNSQMYKACRTTALKTSLKRINEITNLLKTKMKTDYAVLEQMKSLQQQSKNEDGDYDEEIVSKLYLESFYDKLRHVREYHAKYGSNEDRPMKRTRYGNVEADGYDLSSIIQTSCSSVPNGTLFSIEEVLGKYLDLLSIHEYAVNDFPDFFSSNNDSTNSYVDFLQILSKYDVNYFSSTWKLSHRKKYNHVLNLLRSYLEDFLSRAFPLLNVQNDIIQPVLKERQLSGDGDEASINWDGIQSVDDLMQKYTPNDLKVYLTKLNMKCGGTPLERAKRLFLSKDTPIDQLPSKLFVNKSKMEKNNLDILEVIVFALLQQLRPTLETTIRRAERRMTQTISEKERELEEEMYGDTSILALPNKEGDDENEDDEEEDAPIYNPKGVPLGWDGKPIPYWLFKLHGLNHFFTCEICGNESYRGRHTFEKHFTESKHAYGMRCLGIPNTKHFHGITNIEDAKLLWEKLCVKMENDVFDAEKEEEYEDSHGNVLSRAAYEDLARQGML